MRLAIPDLISNSYFPGLAAAELGFFEREGIAVSAELIFPVDRAYKALRAGKIDFVGGAAHGALAAFPAWRGVKLLGALAQGMYWFLVMRADLGIGRGDLHALKGLRIGAAPWVEMGLRRLLAAAGIDPKHEHIEIGPVPGTTGSSVNFGLTAAEALAAGRIDGFWANGMATELAVTTGVGAIVLDVRRGDGPPGCFDYTMPVLATTDALIERSPEIGRGSGPRAGRSAECPETRCVARHRSWTQTLPAARGGVDRRHRAPRSAFLRRFDRRGFNHRNQLLRPRDGCTRRRGALRSDRRDAIPPFLVRRKPRP